MLKLINSLYFLIGLSLFNHAQDVLSLSDAIQIGLERNYGIRTTEKDVLIAKNNNTLGAAGFLPSISLNVNSNNSIRNQQSDNQFFGGQLFDGFELKDQRSFALTPSLTASWIIFQGGRAIINKRILEKIQEESSQNAEVVISNTIQAIVLGYYMAVLEKERVEEFQKQLQLSSQKYDYINTRYDIGSVVSSDVLLEENNYLTDSANYINQVLVYRNAIRMLNSLLAAEDINQDYVLTDSLIYEDVNYQLEDLQQAMFSENIDLKSIYISQSILESQTRLQTTGRYPALSLNGGYQWNRNVSDLTNAEYSGPNTNYQNPPEPLISKSGTYFANFTLSFNLFDGGRVNRAIKNAIILEDIGNIEIERLKTSLSQSLSEAYDQYMTRKQLYFINQRKKAGADTNLRISEEKFRNGTINSFDYRTVQNNYLTAAIQELDALYFLIDAKVSLMRLTGGILSDYQSN